MATRDWALVFFTLLTQAAVGAFVTLHVLQLLAGRRRAHGGGSAAAGVPEQCPDDPAATAWRWPGRPGRCASDPLAGRGTAAVA